MALGASGFLLIAACYGLARYSFGLFLPAISVNLSLSPVLAGVIAGGAFAGYCMAILVSTWLAERLGPRAVAALAGLIAGTGLLAMALSVSAPMLAASVLFAGLSTGLVSPPMAAAVEMSVTPHSRPLVNTVINAGTSGGVVLSGLAALALGAHWRYAFALFGVMSFAVTIPALFVTPKGGGRRAPPRRVTLSPGLVRLMAAAFLTGMVSTAIWSFGAVMTTRSLGANGQAGLFWIVAGVSGAAGALAGSFTNRWGVNAAHRVFLVLTACAVAMVGLASSSVSALVGGAVFGAAYVTLTGIYLVWGIVEMPERPAAGLTVGFLSIAVGQIVGAPLFGSLLDAVRTKDAAVVFAILALVTCLIRAPGRTSPQPAPR